MKRLFLFLTFASVFFSCQDTKNQNITDYSIDEPYVFYCLYEPDVLEQLGSLDDRFTAFQIPESVLPEMSTGSLILTMLHYPLNSYWTAYNEPDYWIRLSVEKSNLFRELVVREDLLVEMTDYFDKILMGDSVAEYQPFSLEIPYLSHLFFEYFIVYVLENTDAKSDFAKLADIAERKEKERNSDPAFSTYSIKPLKMIISMISEK